MATRVRSIEPGRRKPYSADLRWRVVWQHLALGLNYLQIATNLDISLGTAYNIVRLFKATGEVHPKVVSKRRERSLDSYHEMYVIGLVLDSPQLQLTELIKQIKEATNTVVSTSTVCRLLAHFGFIRKKVQQVALQQSVHLRNTYIYSRDVCMGG